MAGVNFGKKTAFMKRMADERLWLVKTYCANHRVELAVKEAIIALHSRQYTIHTLYPRIIPEECKSENIQDFTLRKITAIYCFLPF